VRESLFQLAVRKDDRESFSSLARQLGLKNYALFSKILSFYMQNNRKEIEKNSEI